MLLRDLRSLEYVGEVRMGCGARTVIHTHLEPQSRHTEPKGTSAKEYLAKAETLFHEMDLDWDLEQLERVRADHA